MKDFKESIITLFATVVCLIILFGFIGLLLIPLLNKH